MKHVLIIYTGGTIGMAKTSAGYTPQGPAFHALLNTLPELKDPIMPSWDIIDMDPLLDSSNITVREWNLIGQMIADHYPPSKKPARSADTISQQRLP